MEALNHTLKADYPPNTLRNVARIGSATPIQLIADVESFFSTDTPTRIKDAVPISFSKDDKNALIIRFLDFLSPPSNLAFRRFEMEPNIYLPISISNLSKLYNMKQ